MSNSTEVVFRGDGEPKEPGEMLRRLAEFHGEVGLELDDFSRGGTVEKLELRMAEMLGKEAAVFMPTGTLANHLAIRRHCGVRPRAVVQEQGHVYNDTGDSVTGLSSINLVPLGKGMSGFTLDELKEAVERSETGRVANEIGAVVIESPVRRQEGRVVSFDRMEEITGFCAQRGISTHLDAARLYMMSAATGIEPRRYTALYDSVYVSLYKYFGAPFGAVLAGEARFIEDMYHHRRMFGSGLPSSALAAALALQGAQGFEERFAAAMERARSVFARVSHIPGVDIRPFADGSNIFPMTVEPGIDADKLVSSLSREGVFVYPEAGSPRRILLTVNITVLRRSEDGLVDAFKRAVQASRDLARVSSG